MNAPTGFVSFLFTDIEGSTLFWEQHPEQMPAVYDIHDAILRAAVADANGVVYKVAGDAFQIAFHTPADALNAAANAQRALAAATWPLAHAPRVRMAIHACEVTPEADGDYRTPGLNRLGRLLSAAHGGQVLVSARAEEAAREADPALTPRDLGEQQFRDLTPQHVFQLVASGLATDFPPPRGLSAHRDNLPRATTAFVGRAADLAALRDLTTLPGVHLLTVTGPGGMGKTRLALEAAAGLVDAYPGGVWFVPLAAYTDPALVIPAIARALDVRELPGEPLRDAVIQRLAKSPTFLLLDNFEQILDASPLVSDLLAACPGLIVLATSRSPLGLSGEREYPLAPLAAPSAPPSRSHRTETGSSIALAANPGGFEAVQLFVERARAVRPGFTLTPENQEIIAEIARRLDGLPLAIELAAARMRLLAPPQLLARLAERLPLLTGGPRDAPARQQTLTATIAWSHELLDEPARDLFARLAVFSGGATLDAITSVCQPEADDAPADDLLLLDALDALVRQSLVRMEDDPRGDSRLTMLETIREYASLHFREHPDRDLVARRHATWFKTLAARTEAEHGGPQHGFWLDALDADLDNLRAALTFWIKQRDGAALGQMAGSLWRFWWVRGRFSEGRDWLNQAMRIIEADDSTPPGVEALVLDGAGALAEAQGDIDEAIRLHEAALVLWTLADDRIGRARSLQNLGIIELYDLDNRERGRDFFEAALTLVRAENHPRGISAALGNLGDLAMAEGNFVAAADLIAESLDIARQLEDQDGIAACLNALGAAAVFQERFDDAISFYEESLRFWRQLGDAQGISMALGGLGEALGRSGSDPKRGRHLLLESLEIVQDIGDRQGLAFARQQLAVQALAAGEADTAERWFRNSLDVFREIGDNNRVAESLDGLAGVLLARGDAIGAAHVLGATRAWRDANGVVAAPVYESARNVLVAKARLAMGDLPFTQAIAAGQAQDDPEPWALQRLAQAGLAKDTPQNRDDERCASVEPPRSVVKFGGEPGEGAC